MNRDKLLKVLGDMPEESFSFFVLWALTYTNGRLEGFSKDSRDSLVSLKDAAREYFKETKEN